MYVRNVEVWALVVIDDEAVLAAELDDLLLLGESLFGVFGDDALGCLVPLGPFLKDPLQRSRAVVLGLGLGLPHDDLRQHNVYSQLVPKKRATI